MSVAAPVEIGTRGTIASLVMKEIEYFHGLDLGCHGSSKNPQAQTEDGQSSSSSRNNSPWPSFSFWVMTRKKKKKKRRSSNGFVPRMCSMVEVEDGHRGSGVSGFNYMHLKDDIMEFEV